MATVRPDDDDTGKASVEKRDERASSDGETISSLSKEPKDLLLPDLVLDLIAALRLGELVA